MLCVWSTSDSWLLHKTICNLIYAFISTGNGKTNQNQTENCMLPITDSATNGFVLFYVMQRTDIVSSIYLSKVSIQKVQNQITSNSQPPFIRIKQGKAVYYLSKITSPISITGYKETLISCRWCILVAMWACPSRLEGWFNHSGLIHKVYSKHLQKVIDDGIQNLSPQKTDNMLTA